MTPVRSLRTFLGRGLQLLPVTSVLLMVVFSGALLANDASAVNGKLKQQILPLDCIYEEVNDGTGTLIYLTPEECGQIPDPEPEPEEPDPEPETPTPGTVTVVDNGVRISVFRVTTIPTTTTPSTPTPPTSAPGPTIAAEQASSNSNEIIITWKVPAGSSFKEFVIEVRALGSTEWKEVASALENRRSTVITLPEGEYDVRVLGIPTDPNAEPSVLGVTRVVVEYTELPETRGERDYSWIWILIALIAVTTLWWVVTKRRQQS